MTGVVQAPIQTPTVAMERLDSDAFEVFYSRTARALHSYLCRIAGVAGADDLLQESYIRLLGAPSMEESARKAYLYRTATNLAADQWREQARRQSWWRRAFRREEAFAENPDLRADMSALFGRLGVQERALLWLAYVEGADHREIGEILNVKEKSVRVLLFRARRRMEQLLTEHGFRREVER